MPNSSLPVPRALWKRALLSFVLVAAIVTIGTIGMHVIENLSYIDAFYFMSMLATAQGPPTAPATVGGKIFASIMAFVSVGSVVAALAFLFGPFFGALARLGVEHLEKDLRELERRDKQQKP